MLFFNFKDNSEILRHNETMKSSNDDLHYLDARQTSEYYQMQRQKTRKKKEAETFGSQEVDLLDYVISPEGYEKLAFTLYFIFLPYLAGLLFMFLFIAEGNIDHFLVLDVSLFFIVWAIGYEFLGGMALIAIFWSFLNFKKKEPKTAGRRRR